MTYFAHRTAAERYAHARPNVHPIFIERIRELAKIDQPLAKALDVGCGTGQSSVALAKIARQVTATDIAREMLDQAQKHDRITYLQVAAEALPFDDAGFDMVTVGLAFHWIDPQKFMPHALRVLRQGGWLAVYNSSFGAKMRSNDSFSPWMRDVYGQRYPMPPRRKVEIDENFAKKYGFTFAGSEQFVHDIRMSAEQLVEYILTHSNVIHAVEEGSETIESARQWLSGEVRPFFKEMEADFEFIGRIWVLRKSE